MKRRGWWAVGVVVVVVALAAVVWRAAEHGPPPPDASHVAATAPSPQAPATPAATRPTPPAPTPSAATPPDMAYQRLFVDTTHDQAEACLKFTRALDTKPETHYGDYLRIEPAAALALRVDQDRLCLGGLGYTQTYKLTLAAGLPAADGARTTDAETVEVMLGDRPRLVAFVGQGFVLPRANSAGVVVETVNVDKLRIRVLRLGDRLLTQQFATNDGFRGKLNGYGLRELARNRAAILWSGEMTVQNEHNRTVRTAFPLTDVLKPRRPGAFLVVAENAATASHKPLLSDKTDDENGDYDPADWQEIASQWVIDTDLALTTLSGADGLRVFARSLASAKPLAGVQIALVSTGADELGRVTTDANGGALFAPGLLRGRGAAAASAVLAYAADEDFAYLDLKRPAFDLSDRGVTGRATPGAIDAFLYTDRGIYRPGETVQLMTLLRDRTAVALDDTPVTIVLRRPDGVEFRRFALPAQKGGGFHLPIALSDSASRGLWSAEALVDAAGAPVGRVEFDVQDFVPQRLKVKIESAAKLLHPGDPIEVAVDGQFLYGAPAAGLTGEAELKIAADPAPIANRAGYRFGLADETFTEVSQPLEMAAADQAGHTKAIGSLKALAATSLPLKATVTVGLFEPGGRVTQDRLSLPVRSKPLLVGIKPRFADNRAPIDQDALFDVLAFDETGAAVARPGLRYSLIEEQWHYDWYRLQARWDYHVTVTDRPLTTGTLDVGADKPGVIARRLDWGHYRLVVEDPASGAATSVRFRAGWAATAQSADTPDKIDVTVERERYAPGDGARLAIKPPFAGELQLVVASDRVFETRNVSVPAGGTTVELKTDAAWGTGAYVMATLFRPLDSGSAREPVRAIGLAWVGLDMSPRTLNVALSVPDKVTPRHGVDLPLRVTGASGEAAFVTVAAVDEGILQLTRFQTPAPDAFYFGKRRLQVELRDDYGRLLDGNAAVGALRQGGDGIGGKGLPVVPTRSVALFSGIVAVGGDGTATVHLDVPDFEGQLRVMAVAFGHSSVGKADATLIVRDPVIADVALPRFLAPGDDARLSLLVHNTDGAAGDYHVALSASGPVQIKPEHPLDYALAPGERKLDTVPLSAGDVGISTIAAEITGPGGYRVRREWGITVRSPRYPLTLEQVALQPKGERFTLDAHRLEPFLPGSVSVSIGYSRLAGIDVPGLLQSLYRYPYGCSEQLTATAFPLLFYDDEALLGRVAKDQGLKQRLQTTIDKLIERQDASGEFGLWRVGDGEASGWLNLFVLDFLSRARALGYDVPERALYNGYGWARTLLTRLNQGDQGGGAYAQSADETRAYAYYLLAKVGRVDLGDVRYTHDTLVGLGGGTQTVSWRRNAVAEPLALAQLAGALSLLGDKARANSAFDAAIRNLAVTRWPAWWGYWNYYSTERDLAGLIAIAAEVGDTKVVEQLVPRLQRLKLSPEQLNTQQKAWLLAAAHAMTRGEAALELAVDGRPVKNGGGPLALAPGPAEIAAGFSVENRSDRDLWRTVVLHGAPKVAPSAMEEGYDLEKRYFALDGTAVDPATVMQNDRILVSLRGKAHDRASHRTVLVDMLPAGWEIEAVVFRDDEYGFLDKLSKLSLREARDDRFVAAFDVGPRDTRGRYAYNDDDDTGDKGKPKKKPLPEGAFHVAYIVRAITPGRFALPAAVVEDMYRAGTMARTAEAVTTVTARP